MLNCVTVKRVTDGKNHVGKSLKTILTVIVALSLCCGLAVSAMGWGNNEDSSIQSTHTFIVEQALKILENDCTPENDAFKTALNTLKANLSVFNAGAVAPDYGAKNYRLYQDHFYEPTTGKNFTGNYQAIPHVFETAEYRAREYICLALYYWRLASQNGTAYNDAIKYLGYGLHYFDDLNEPHHAGNRISATEELNTYHSSFEKFVDKNLTNASCAVSTLGVKSDQSLYTDLLAKEYFADFLNNTSVKAAKAAYRSFYNDFRSAKFTNGFTPSLVNYLADMDNYVTNYILPNLAEATKYNWNAVAITNITNAQKYTAQVLYRFLKEATASSTVSGTQTTALTIDITTKYDFWLGLHDYGTFDNVYFGVELKDGRIKDIYLDNYFRYGRTNTYTITLNNTLSCQPSDVRKIWIRKQRNIDSIPNPGGDDWYPVKVRVTASSDTASTVTYTQRINRWLTGNAGFLSDISITGDLNPIPAPGVAD
jgi:phospholipase C/alpha-toxin